MSTFLVAETDRVLRQAKVREEGEDGPGFSSTLPERMRRILRKRYQAGWRLRKTIDESRMYGKCGRVKFKV